MNRLIYIPLSAALALPAAESTRDWLGLFAQGIVDGHQLAPYQYRLLFAYLFQPLTEVMPLHIAAWLFWFLSLSVLSLLIDEIMTAVNPGGSKTPLIAALALIPGLIWFHSGGTAWSVLEGIFFAGAILAMIRGKTAVLYSLIFLATLNRETAFLIPSMVILATGDKWLTARLMAVWFLTFVWIRFSVSPAVPQFTLLEVWRLNTGPGFILFLMGLPLFGWLFWYAARGWVNSSGVLRGAAVIAPLYVVLFMVFGVWYEWRWILSIYPVLIPLAGLVKQNEKNRSGYKWGWHSWSNPFPGYHGRAVESKPADFDLSGG